MNKPNQMREMDNKQTNRQYATEWHDNNTIPGEVAKTLGFYDAVRDAAINLLVGFMEDHDFRACTSQHCDWRGYTRDCPTPKHDPNSFLCPICYDSTEVM